MRALELLAPARDAEIGIEAVKHGADAVYIGGPAFGARASAGNELAEIERLAQFAHRFHAQVFVALNTILRDEELEPARRLAWQVFEAGADALIIQDLGLLELDLPPLALHASTQMDNRSVAKVRFLEAVGFSQIVLARELSLAQIREIASQTGAMLEFFVHGALCVSYSGQCYLSYAQTGRSANRGECSQACRLPYDLSDGDGRMLAAGQHLLSMKDNDQRSNLQALIDAGISSFKIEGRLKDVGYVKNVTAWYRQELDRILDARPEFLRGSSGRCTYGFVPQPEKTFNRGATDYFVNGRQPDIVALDTPKFAGEPVGKVLRLNREAIEIEATAQIGKGDGLCYFDAHGELAGIHINRVEGSGRRQRLFPAHCPQDLVPGTELLRNRDWAFLRLLEKPSAARRIELDLRLVPSGSGLALELLDQDGYAARVEYHGELTSARDQEQAARHWHEQLGKLGNTEFRARAVTLELSPLPFLPAAAGNALRRDAVAALIAARAAAYQRPGRAAPAVPPPLYPERELSYLGNVYNAQARAFYARHGVELIADAFEANREKGAVSLMITKHCLRFTFNLCPKEVKGLRPDPMTLQHGKERLTLSFDCRRCEMHVVGKLSTKRVDAL
ncbi:MAG: U32 family peptidase [Betaproteobacteria bacterium]|nr:U32 family peptidase [Betaproteobacteria bacterium]